jgi:hypothetical protein
MTKTLKSILFVAVLCTFRALSVYADAAQHLASSGSPTVGAKPAAPADGVIYSNGVTGNVGLSSQNDTVYPFNSQVADNFTLAIGNGLAYSVSGITFRGQYFNTATAPATDTFNILIYANNGGVPTGGGLGDPSPTALFTRTLNNVVGTPTGGSLEFDWNLSWAGTPFVLTPGVQFWVAVQEVGSFAAQGQWGWSGSQAGGNAVQGFPLLSIPYWTPISPGTEMQFQLIGAQVPEPASVLLLIPGLGLVGFIAHRRRKAA